MRVMIALVIASVALLGGNVGAEDPVVFGDETLKAAVEEALWIPDPTPTDMLGLTSLSAGSAGIGSITGLAYATNLQSLSLPCNRITSISDVSGLTYLQKLVLNNNQISSLSPLSGLTQLEHLDLHDNHLISSLSPLSSLTKLRILILRGNRISDLSVLAGLTALESLRLENNEIADVAPLAGLTSLQRLDLRGNPLNETAYDTYIPQIVANNPGINLTYPASDACFRISSSAGGAVIEPGEGEFDFTRTEYVRIEAQADPGFVFMEFVGSYSTTQNPIRVPVDQSHQIRAVFASVLDTLYVDDNAPDDPAPDDPAVSDPLESGAPEHPFDSIQEAIEVAPAGASLLVRSGTYRESIAISGKGLQIIGIDPCDPDQMGLPVIAGVGQDPPVRFTPGEDPNCLLAGFVLSGGRAQPAGAMLCMGSSPTIANCLIVGNRSTDTNGAAVHCSDSAAVFVNCTIADNHGSAGLCIVDSNVAVVNSILWDNGTHAITANDESILAVNYTNVAGGWPGPGNMAVEPMFVERGYWADPYHSSVALAPANRNAVWIAGDYHLKSQSGRWDPQAQAWVQDEATSPCIDAGDPLGAVGAEPAPNGALLNLRAYGGTAAASKSY